MPSRRQSASVAAEQVPELVEPLEANAAGVLGFLRQATKPVDEWRASVLLTEVQQVDHRPATTRRLAKLRMLVDRQSLVWSSLMGASSGRSTRVRWRIEQAVSGTPDDVVRGEN